MYLAFDTETTGLDHKTQNLLTGHFIIFDKEFVVIDELGLKLKSDTYNVSIKALQINKIDLIKHDNNASTLQNSRDAFLKFLEKNKPKYRYILVGHNIQFDIDFLLSSNLLSKSEFDNYFSYNYLDTLVIGQFLKMCGKIEQNKSLSLVNLCKTFNIPVDNEKAHDAEYDIKMNVELLKKFKESTENVKIDVGVDNQESKKRKRIE